MQTANEIKNSLLKKLEVVWQKSEEDIENLIKFDPVVRLFFHALLYQFEDVHNNLAEFKKEILSDLGKRLMPDNHFFAMPAFGVIKTDPTSTDTIFNIKPDRSFSTPRKIKDKIANLNFIPITETQLIPGTLKIIAGGNTVYKLQAKSAEDRLQIINTNNPNSDRTLWIGINIPKNTSTSLEKITFFIDYDLNKSENKLYFDELVNAEWSVRDFDCSVSKGIDTSCQAKSVLSRVSRFEMVKERVLHFFAGNFITLHLENTVENSESGSKNQTPEVLKSIDNSVHFWISIKCNSAIPIDFFMNNAVHLNAFPVINCTHKSDRLTKNEPIKNFNLDDEEYFFELFYPDGFDVNNNFTIRSTRFKSFDSKDLSIELRVLNRLFNQARALFENNNHLEEEEINVFREFSNILSDLELRFKNEGIKLAKENISTRDTIDRVKEYKYLTTFGVFGNGGEPGDPFKYGGPGLNEKNTRALTSFAGGANPLQEDETMDKFRYLLLTRDRIVTREDIKVLVYYIFQEKHIKHVNIKQTTTSGLGKIGLHRAMKIEIHIKPSCGLEKSELDFMRKELIGQLENKSSGVMPFIVEIKS